MKRLFYYIFAVFFFAGCANSVNEMGKTLREYEKWVIVYTNDVRRISGGWIASVDPEIRMKILRAISNYNRLIGEMDATNRLRFSGEYARISGMIAEAHTLYPSSYLDDLLGALSNGNADLSGECPSRFDFPHDIYFEWDSEAEYPVFQPDARYYDFYPIGWSTDGKFAYVVVLNTGGADRSGADFAVSTGTDVRLTIQNLKTDAVIDNWVYASEKTVAFREVWLSNYGTIRDKLAKAGIVRTDNYTYAYRFPYVYQVLQDDADVEKMLFVHLDPQYLEEGYRYYTMVAAKCSVSGELSSRMEDYRMTAPNLRFAYSLQFTDDKITGIKLWTGSGGGGETESDEGWNTELTVEGTKVVATVETPLLKYFSLAGFFVSPYEERIALIVLEEYFSGETEDDYVLPRVVGCNLITGFKP